MPEPKTAAPQHELSESAQIAALKDKLECANRSRHEFLIGMNHRFRTPLSGVLGMLELLAASKLDEEQSSRVATAMSSGRAVMRVFDELLDYCRAEAGELVLTCETFSPENQIDSLLAEFQNEADEKGVELSHAQSPEAPLSIQGDSKRLFQILHELIENALRYTTDGEVEVGMRPLDADGGEPKLLYWVKDTGCGLTEDQLMRVFELDMGVGAESGIRIGLPAVRHILDAMGGAIDIDSEPGEGTTVRFSIPTDPNWKATAVSSTHLVPAAGRPPKEARRAARVLVVEDDLVNQRVTLGYLKLVGYEGTVVDSGEGAIRALATQEYDLVLMDMMMPGMSGIETTVAIRKGHGAVLNTNIPIIALTAEVSVQARRECLNSGMNDYLTKPIRKKEIDPVIRAWLPPHLRPARKVNRAG